MQFQTATPVLQRADCAVQKYSYQVKRRLVDEADLPDSTAHLENMVSAFVSPYLPPASALNMLTMVQGLLNTSGTAMIFQHLLTCF